MSEDLKIAKMFALKYKQKRNNFNNINKIHFLFHKFTENNPL